MKDPMMNRPATIRASCRIDGLPGNYDLNMILTDNLGRQLPTPCIDAKQIEWAELALYEARDIRPMQEVREMQRHRDEQIRHFFSKLAAAMIEKLHETEGVQKAMERAAKS